MPPDPRTTPERFDVVIVGASLAGLSTAEALRAEGFTGSIALIGAERHPPYHRPPLSKQVLRGTWSVEQARIRTAEELAALDVELRLGERAGGLDPIAHTVLVGADAIAYGTLVIATGAAPRTIAELPLGPGVVELHTLDDVVALGEALRNAQHVAVIGAGVLGCELASALGGLGHEVTLIGRAERLRFGGLGTLLSERIAAVLQTGGVELRLGVAPIGLRPGDGSRATGVRLADGSIVTADLVILAVGCVPATDWLAGSGLTVEDGVVCDEQGMAAPGVYAVGDVAAWSDPRTGRHRRVEHQQHAIEQAHALARHLVRDEASAPIEPFFWSELFGARILAHGTFPASAATTPVAGDPASDRFVLAAAHHGLVGWNMPREFRLARAERQRTGRHTAGHTPHHADQEPS